MEFRYRYHGASRADTAGAGAALAFAPDTLREPTYFVATLMQRVAFREAVSALHQVVVSDLRLQPRDRSEYLAWAREHEAEQLAAFIADGGALRERARALRAELYGLRRTGSKLLAPYFAAQRRYFRYLWQHDKAAWAVLDPVITVHPDQLFFECFSRDESSYARLACDYQAFDDVREFACGTTNIDYSAALYREFQRLRDDKLTAFAVDPGGFGVETAGDDAFHEEKIDLPDSWVRGFLQVSAAMTLPHRRLSLHPLDIYNLCLRLRRRRERHGPRSLRFLLRAGEPARILIEPWNLELRCPRSVYHGGDDAEIRVWGRRRLLLLERLIPLAERVDVYLLGSGLPSFYVARLGALTFTLGLSGWTANDWSRLGAFDLLAAREEVDAATRRRVFDALAARWLAGADELADALGLARVTVASALGAYAQAGRVIYDLERGVYRRRELSREPLPLDRLRFSSPQEEAARGLLDAGAVSLRHVNGDGDARVTLAGRVGGRDGVDAALTLDADGRLVDGRCGCRFHRHNRLRRGPCEHLLALRMAHAAGSSARRRRRP